MKCLLVIAALLTVVSNVSAAPTDVPLAVLCDNSRDAEMIPPDLSDFNRYGGIYRHVTLTYVPAISLKRVHVEPILTVEGKASVEIRARLFNPKSLNGDVELKHEISDQIEVAYQTAVWGKPTKLELKEIARKDGTTTIKASVSSDGLITKLLNLNNPG